MAGEDGDIGGGGEIGEDGDIMEAPGADLGGGGGPPPPPPFVWVWDFLGQCPRMVHEPLRT